MSPQHDEAPAPPEESGSAAGSGQSTGSDAAAEVSVDPAAPDVSVDPAAADGPDPAAAQVSVDPASADGPDPAAADGPEPAAAQVSVDPAAADGPDPADSPGAGGSPLAGAVGYAQNPPAAATAPSASVGKTAAGGRTIFRRGTPFVVWWLWVAFAIWNAAQIVIPDHDYSALELAAGLLAVTGVMYACTLRPRVIADEDGLLVRNPFRDHRIRWGALTGVYLGDCVELGCARPAPKKEKTIYCWALYSGRRSRVKARVHAERDRARSYGWRAAGRTSATAPELARQDTVQLMAAEIGRRSTDAKQRGAPQAVLESAWAWWPLVYLLVPAALLVGLVLGR